MLTFYSTGFNSDIYYNGDIIESNDKIDILIGNHFNYIDFIIYQGIFRQLSDKEIAFLYSKKIEKVPVIGRGFKYGNGLGLKKKIHLDIDNIKEYIKNNNNIVIILYPEGTRITDTKLKKSQMYSKENNLPIYNHLLYPKMKGIFTIINELKKHNKLGNIIDFTVKVENTNINDNTIKDYLSKKLGKTYIKINTYKISDFDDYDNFKKWFNLIWTEKEKYLDNYKNYNYIKLDTRLKTSIKIITIFNIVIFCKIVHFLYFSKLSIFKFNIRTIIS